MLLGSSKPADHNTYAAPAARDQHRRRLGGDVAFARATQRLDRLQTLQRLYRRHRRSCAMVPWHGHSRNPSSRSPRSNRGTKDPKRAPSTTIEPEPIVRIPASSRRVADRAPSAGSPHDATRQNLATTHRPRSLLLDRPPHIRRSCMRAIKNLHAGRCSRRKSQHHTITPGPHDDAAGLAATFRAAHDAHSSSHIAALTTEAAAAVMARRLHIGVKAMRRLPTFTTDAPPSLVKVRVNPSTTTASAIRRLSHIETRYVESTPGRLFHMDICGPLPESKLGRFRYAMVLVDDQVQDGYCIALARRGRRTHQTLHRALQLLGLA